MINKFFREKIQMRAEDELIITTARTEIEEEVVRKLLKKEPDWNYILRTASLNRLDGLVFNSLDRLGLFEKLPEGIQKKFEDRYRQTVINTRIYLDAAEKLVRECEKQGIDIIVLRGLALGATVYKKPYLRPFSDLDLLIRKADFPAVREIFKKHGFAPPPGLLPERYFLKYHLHLQLKEGERGVVAEIHWSLDHPYSLYTIDYPRLLRGKREAEFSGIKLPVLNPEDRLLTLSLHLFKHCPFLPALLKEDNFPSLLLRGKWLIWLLDIHQTLIPGVEDLDWEVVREKAADWNLKEQLTACLEAVERVYQLPVPSPWKHRPSRLRMNYLEKKIYGMQLSLLRGEEQPGSFARHLFALRPDAIFRPVRLLDLWRCFFPPPEYLRKRYRVRGVMIAAIYFWHPIRTMGRFLRNLVEFLYYNLIFSPKK